MKVLIGHLEFVANCGQIYLTKTVSFQYTTINKQSKIEEKEMEMKGTSTNPKHLTKSCQWRRSAESLQNIFRSLNQALKYAQYQFQNKPWNKNEMLDFLRTFYFSKNMAFNAIETFSTRARISWTRCWSIWEHVTIWTNE